MTGEFKREFRNFWTNTAGKVRAYMFCASENWADADDMTQDVYLRALRGWNQFNGTASRQAWLFGIAKRTRSDFFRQKKRESFTAGSDSPEKFDKVVSDGTAVDNIEKVWDAVRELNDEQSQVVHLRFAAGLSYAQIAQALGIPIGTVRSRLHRGLKSIRENIGNLENGT
ncbi:MAG TPA: sigma-70 family RNA polymerase sigma factor [Sedimentisphaerales bacterium]|nr:sigma-70 family RNA polymerase sigma factor [Sedimentisphaerales bacterium]